MSLKVYLENENQIKLVQTIASASSAISSLASEAKNYIVSKFPKDYFRSIQIETASASSSTNKNRNFNQNLHKIPYPSLMISPEITIDNPIAGTETDPHTSNPNIWLQKDLPAYYYKLLTDPSNKLAMYYTTDTFTTIFNFKIAVKSFIQCVNLVYFLKNELHIGMFQYLNSRALNTEIPKTFISILKEIFDKNHPSNNEDESLAKFQEYLIAISRKHDSIRKKLDMTTGKYGFFFNDLTDLITVVDGLDAPSGMIRDSQAESEYLINFRLQITAPIANNFILSINKKVFKMINDNVALVSELINSNGRTGALRSNFMTFALPSIKLAVKDMIEFKDNIGNIHIGSNILTESMTYDINTKYSHINLVPFLKESILKAHSYLIAKHIDPSSFIYIRIEDARGIIEDANINLNTLEIDIDNIQSDIVISVFVDRSTYDAIVKAQEKDSPIFSDDFLTSLRVQYPDENGNVKDRFIIVKAFANDAELSSKDLEKRVRVNTIYGIGYLYLVPETNPLASNIKICLGKDKWNNDIIRCCVLLPEDK